MEKRQKIIQVKLFGGYHDLFADLQEKGYATSEIVRDALALLWWALERVEEGHEVAAVDNTGRVIRGVETPLLTSRRAQRKAAAPAGPAPTPRPDGADKTASQAAAQPVA